MTVSDREPSPFSGTGLNKGRKKAFATVAVLAALSCGWAGYGFYIDFLRVLPATATFYLTTADRMTRVSLLNPQPPEIREREKNAATETQADNPPAALFKQVRVLHEQPDAAAQKKIDEIDSLEKERTELENKKRQVLNDLENGGRIGLGRVRGETLLALASLVPGAGERTLLTLVRHCGLHRVELVCAVENPRAMALYDRLHFSRGKLRQSWYCVE